MTPEERAEFRDFVRTHHPDRGGDPDAFVAGMARFATRPETQPEAAAARFDAPIEVVTPLPVPLRVAVALIRTLRWHRQQRRVE
ncbi:hypothetical protein [Pseudonocardia sp. GCM10023141]|uniref:hypothetical protein n=1 Tax=Pseudonocardia sp. GCM10023141 TaxID=3252653 RepID=UPI00360B6C7B